MLERRRLAVPTSKWGSRAFGQEHELLQFQRSFANNLKQCPWKPHPQYSVFTQFDQSFYLENRLAFRHKYRCFFAVSKTIAPKRIIELGTHAGSSADAYISASPDAEYIGLDQFEEGVLSGSIHERTGEPWRPMEVARKLFESRGFKKYELRKADLRSLDKLPALADMVVVDAAHDFDNTYADLLLALTGEPTYIFVDDAEHPTGTMPALEKFIAEEIKDRIDFFCGIGYYGGGLVIKLKTIANSAR